MDTLSKYGVPTGGGGGRGGLIQLKYAWRFRVRVINFGPIAGGLDLTQQVESIGKPKINYDPVEVHSYNSTAYFTGKHKWESVQLVVKDDLTNSVSKMVGHQIQKQLNHFEQTAFAAGINYKFVTLIETLDGGNDNVIETWTLEGCFLENIEYGELNYTQGNEYQKITMNIRYDNATQGDGLMTVLPELIPGVRV